jgi:SNF2 family DNA or RNA helicase
MLHRNNMRPYQVTGVDFIKDNQGSALFLNMGLGKTGTTLTAILDLLDDFEIIKPLIVAPLRVANTVWRQEGQEWSHLKHLNFSIITGNLKERISALHTDADVYVINRENIPWLVEYYKSKFPFDMLIIDESTSFKNPTSKRFRALKSIMKYIRKSVILTGTPAPNGYGDLFSQIYLVDEGERLGKNVTRYRNTYFDKDFMGFNYVLKEGAAERIQEKIKDIVYHVPTEGNVDLPDVVSTVIDTPLTPALMKKYKDFEEDMIMMIEDNEITSMSAAALSNKLLQFSSGAVYDEDQNIHQIHDLKFDTLDEVIEENPNDNILVAYNFKHELLRLKKRYPSAVVLSKGGSEIKAWNEGKIKMLLVHPASAGHGLNLQHGGSLAVWFGFTWSLENYQQLNKRLHRSGQKNTVRLVHIAVGAVEYRLMKALAKKDVTQSDLLRSLL